MHREHLLRDAMYCVFRIDERRIAISNVDTARLHHTKFVFLHSVSHSRFASTHSIIVNAKFSAAYSATLFSFAYIHSAVGVA